MSATETVVTKRTIKDDQTGQDFEVVPEGPIDILFAWISAFYSLAVIAYLAWVVVAVLWRHYGPGAPVALVTYPKTFVDQLAWTMDSPVSKLILYTAIGGAIGAAVNNLRSFISWHAERRAFGWRFIWKYLALPPLGATLAVLVYGILQGGMAVFNGGSVSQTTVTSLSAWATGTLAGYGSHKVFKWLDEKVNALFKTDVKQVAVPNLIGMLEADAKRAVLGAQLVVGELSQQAANPDQLGKVIAQSPPAVTLIDCGSKVDLTIGIEKAIENPPPGSGTPTGIDTTIKSNGTGATSNGDSTTATVTEIATTTVTTGEAGGNGTGTGTNETSTSTDTTSTTITGAETETGETQTEETTSEATETAAEG